MTSLEISTSGSGQEPFGLKSGESARSESKQPVECAWTSEAADVAERGDLRRSLLEEEFEELIMDDDQIITQAWMMVSGVLTMFVSVAMAWLYFRMHPPIQPTALFYLLITVIFFSCSFGTLLLLNELHRLHFLPILLHRLGSSAKFARDGRWAEAKTLAWSAGPEKGAVGLTVVLSALLVWIGRV